jgi:hypothetical protein
MSDEDLPYPAAWETLPMADPPRRRCNPARNGNGERAGRVTGDGAWVSRRMESR